MNPAAATAPTLRRGWSTSPNTFGATCGCHVGIPRGLWFRSVPPLLRIRDVSRRRICGRSARRLLRGGGRPTRIQVTPAMKMRELPVECRAASEVVCEGA